MLLLYANLATKRHQTNDDVAHTIGGAVLGEVHGLKARGVARVGRVPPPSQGTEKQQGRRGSAKQGQYGGETHYQCCGRHLSERSTELKRKAQAAATAHSPAPVLAFEIVWEHVLHAHRPPTNEVPCGFAAVDLLGAERPRKGQGGGTTQHVRQQARPAAAGGAARRLAQWRRPHAWHPTALVYVSKAQYGSK